LVERGDEAEGFLIVTAAADKGLVDIHDRRPLVLVPNAAREWMRQDVSGKEAEEIASEEQYLRIISSGIQ
jgi:putative SOS response-associated peptidase YedK